MRLFGRKKEEEETGKPSDDNPADAKLTEPLAKEPPKEPSTAVRLPFAPSKTIRDEEVTKARQEMKVSTLLREITSYGLTRLYEAETEGKITVEERDNLTKKYKDELSQLEGRLNYDQSVIDLYRLEETQSELIGMFYEKINELNHRIDELRTNIAPTKVEIVVEGKPIEELKEDAAKAGAQPEKAKPKKPEPKPVPKSPTEQKIESIREEVLKLIEKLDKTETEA